MPSISSPNEKQQAQKYKSQTSIMYKREPEKRIFVNRSMKLDKIQFFGFDMDYTLAVYKSPRMESEAFSLVLERLIYIGYPKEIRNFKYDPAFVVRGLWFDTMYGNLLKVDGFGNILVAAHGLVFLTGAEIENFYPNKFIQLSDRRIYVLNTLFNLPETNLIALLVDFFDKSDEYQLTQDKTGLRHGDAIMSYKSIFQDIRGAVDFVHGADADLKKKVIANIADFVEKDLRISKLLVQLRVSGRKTFLLTNSEYEYTKAVMTFLLGDKWRDFFDIIIVDARKPLWFGEGTVFREVNTETGALKIGIPIGPLRSGAVYSGGSCEAFRRLVKAKGRDVLYIGDHIFGDVLRSKKTRGWKTFLIVPELNRELAVWTGKRDLFDQLRELEAKMADLYKNLDADTRGNSEMKNILEPTLKSIREVTIQMDNEYSVFGSLFRSGSRTTFFASQVERYADLYASSCFNLVYYPTFYFFRAAMSLMPHESTVQQTAALPPDQAEQIAKHGNDVRDLSQRMVKGPTFCFEEDDEGGEGSGQGSTPNNTARPDTGGESETDNEEIKEDGHQRLNSRDVIVPKTSFVESGN
ncbi:hypothetical protein ACQ4LE_003495 [Meloidogyne hapla]|uniref:5'-nucleotidase n=1 Tax=Meloidogyne hapla TaxID=6305 RepID=A0A1I8B0W7_MELHA